MIQLYLIAKKDILYVSGPLTKQLNPLSLFCSVNDSIHISYVFIFTGA